MNRILDYQLVRVLGRGTIATVYRALHIPTGRVVALKVLHHEHARNPQAMQRFLREMTAITVLDHPHIVRSVDSDVQCTTPYIAMQLLDGLDLRTLSQMYGALSIADCCQLARQAALGLQHVFEHGLVHRDIKPSNLMLSWTCADQRTAVVQIVDFGLVFMPELDSGGTASTAKYRGMGTVNYVAPEQIINGYDVDIRADLYSLGCTIYQLLAGHPPFGGPEYDHPVKTALAHLHDRPVPIAERRGAVPKPLARIVHRLLAKDRRQRFSTPGEVATALEAFVAGSRLEDLLTGPSSRVDSVPINRERFSMYECLRPIAPQDETL